MADIQGEEERARRSSNLATLQGHSSPWLVERRPRADSLEFVFQVQAREAQEAREKLAEEEEILRAVQEIDRKNATLAATAAQTAAKPKGNKKKSNNSKTFGKAGAPAPMKK